jgi:hypothetical protein
MSKAQALWNTQSQYTVFADIMDAELGKRLKVHNATRGDSTYDFAVAINIFLNQKRAVTNSFPPL